MRAQQQQLADPAPGLTALPAPDRERALAAITETFATEGYGATTREHLQLRIHPFVFDSFFTGKEDCFLAAFDHLTAQAREEIAASAPVADSWPQRLAAGLRTLLELIVAQPLAARLVLVEAQVATPTITGRFFEGVKSAGPFMREGRILAGERIPVVADSILPGGVASILADHVSGRREEPVSGLYGELLQVLLSPYADNPDVASFDAIENLGERA